MWKLKINLWNFSFKTTAKVTATQIYKSNSHVCFFGISLFHDAHCDIFHDRTTELQAEIKHQRVNVLKRPVPLEKMRDTKFSFQ